MNTSPLLPFILATIALTTGCTHLADPQKGQLGDYHYTVDVFHKLPPSIAAKTFLLTSETNKSGLEHAHYIRQINTQLTTAGLIERNTSTNTDYLVIATYSSTPTPVPSPSNNLGAWFTQVQIYDAHDYHRQQVTQLYTAKARLTATGAHRKPALEFLIAEIFKSFPGAPAQHREDTVIPR